MNSDFLSAIMRAEQQPDGGWKMSPINTSTCLGPGLGPRGLGQDQVSVHNRSISSVSESQTSATHHDTQSSDDEVWQMKAPGPVTTMPGQPMLERLKSPPFLANSPTLSHKKKVLTTNAGGSSGRISSITPIITWPQMPCQYVIRNQNVGTPPQCPTSYGQHCTPLHNNILNMNTPIKPFSLTLQTGNYFGNANLSGDDYKLSHSPIVKIQPSCNKAIKTITYSTARPNATPITINASVPPMQTETSSKVDVAYKGHQPKSTNVLPIEKQREILDKVQHIALKPGLVFDFDGHKYLWNGHAVQNYHATLPSSDKPRLSVPVIKIIRSPGNVVGGRMFKHATDFQSRPLHHGLDTSKPNAVLTPDQDSSNLELLSTTAVLQEKITAESSTHKKRPERLPRVPPDDGGDYFILCKYCGALSKNYIYCDACKKEIPESEKFYDPNKGNRSVTLIKPVAKFYSNKSKHSEENMGFRSSPVFGNKRRSKGKEISKGRTKKMKVPPPEPELVDLLSSDDETIPAESSSTSSSGRSTPNSLTNNTVTTSSTTSKPVKHQSKSPPPPTISCRKITLESVSSRKARMLKKDGSTVYGDRQLSIPLPRVLDDQQKQNELARKNKITIVKRGGTKELLFSQSGAITLENEGEKMSLEKKIIGLLKDEPNSVKTEKMEENITPTKEPVKGRLSEPSVSSTMFDVRNIRVGSLRGAPFKSFVLTHESLAVNMEGEKDTYDFTIPTKEIDQCLIHMGYHMPCIFVITSSQCAKEIRDHCQMNDPTGPFYDPDSEVEEHKRITILISKLSQNQGFEIIQILSAISQDHKDSNMLVQLDNDGANNILIMSSGSSASHTLQKSESISRSSTPDLKDPKPPVVKLLTWPPRPATGGITITTEDVDCLNEEEYLNDIIIDFYLKYLVGTQLTEKDRQRTHVYSSFFYKRLTTKPVHRTNYENDPALSLIEKRHHRVKTWTRHIDIFSKDFLLIPINENSHWFLAIICFPSLEKPQVSNVFVKYRKTIKTESYQACDTSIDKDNSNSCSKVNLEGHKDPQVEEPKVKVNNEEEDMDSDTTVGKESQDDSIKGERINSCEEDPPIRADLTKCPIDPDPITDKVTNCQNEDRVDQNEKVSNHGDDDEMTVKSEVKEENDADSMETNGMSTTSEAQEKGEGIDRPKANFKEEEKTDQHCLNSGVPKNKSTIIESRMLRQQCLKQSCILIFDSLNNTSHNTVVKTLKEYLQVEWNVRKRTPRLFNKDTIKGSTPRIPQQDNYSDCGVFVLQYAQTFFEKPLVTFSTPVKGLDNWFNISTVKQKRQQIRQLIYDLKETEDLKEIKEKQVVKTEPRNEVSST